MILIPALYANIKLHFSDEDQPKMGNLMHNSEVVSFLKNMFGEKIDFFVKLKDMQMRNVSFSEAGENQLGEAG